MWQDVIAELGLTVETVDAGHVRLRGEHWERVLRLRRIDRPISSSQLPHSPAEPALLSLPRATRQTIADAESLGWYVVTDAGEVSLALRGARAEGVQASGSTGPKKSQPGPKPWATYTVARRLLAAAPVIQTELAHLSGVGQPKVSRVLRRLRDQCLVERVTDGWRPAAWDALFGWWLANYRGPQGIASYWYSLDDPTTQVKSALGLLSGVSGSRPVVSGDVAADLLAPWHRPTSATIYIRAGTSLTKAGFVPVGAPTEATLTLCAAEDPGIWLPQPWLAHGTPIADPLQIAYDLSTSAASDTDEAVDQLRLALRGRLAATWRTAVGAQQ